MNISKKRGTAFVLLVLVIIISLAIIPYFASGIYLGVVEGYIHNSTGIAEGATVNVTVSGCSEACTGSTTSDSGGYYVVANLNLPAGGTVTVDASKGNSYGQNTGTADSFQSAIVNVTMCTAPSAPTLVPIADTHNRSFFNFSWTSYGGNDTFYLDGDEDVNVTSPQYRYNLDWGSYTWGVKSCSGGCCSSYTYDSFEVTNSAPPKPTLTDQTDTINDSVTLYWGSVADPDGDDVYYDFYIDSTDRYNVTSPQTVLGLSFGSHTWGVRACDHYDTCSAWETDDFSVVCEAPSAPSLVAVADSHDNSYFLMNWTNGTDPNLLATYTEFSFDYEGFSEKAPPQTETNLDFDTYTWRVRTCNPNCCSSVASDTFEVYNSPPPIPSLTDQPNTIVNNVTLYWSSGGADPDGDSTYFDYQFDGDFSHNVTSPQNETGFGVGTHTWKVRECDPYECSAWASDSFTITNDPPSSPSLTDQGHTDSATVSFTWTSGTDPESDPTHDDIQIDGTTYSNVSSPYSKSFSGIDYHTWRVRTCEDGGSCSSWSSDTFIRYECPSNGGGNGGGGGGGSCTTCPAGEGCSIGSSQCSNGDMQICIPYKKSSREICGKWMTIACPAGTTCSAGECAGCLESWQCEEWGPCSERGIQLRECVDINECGTGSARPIEWQMCEPGPSCYDGIINQEEDAPDCGGPCRPCTEEELEEWQERQEREDREDREREAEEEKPGLLPKHVCGDGKCALTELCWKDCKKKMTFVPGTAALLLALMSLVPIVASRLGSPVYMYGGLRKLHSLINHGSFTEANKLFITKLQPMFEATKGRLNHKGMHKAIREMYREANLYMTMHEAEIAKSLNRTAEYKKLMRKVRTIRKAMGGRAPRNAKAFTHLKELLSG